MLGSTLAVGVLLVWAQTHTGMEVGEIPSTAAALLDVVVGSPFVGMLLITARYPPPNIEHRFKLPLFMLQRCD